MACSEPKADGGGKKGNKKVLVAVCTERSWRSRFDRAGAIFAERLVEGVPLILTFSPPVASFEDHFSTIILCLASFLSPMYLFVFLECVSRVASKQRLIFLLVLLFLIALMGFLKCSAETRQIGNENWGTKIVPRCRGGLLDSDVPFDRVLVIYFCSFPAWLSF